jgi:hypothetical protein
MNRHERRASSKQQRVAERASRQKHQYVRVEFRPDGGFVVLEACGSFYPGSPEALALHDVERSLYTPKDLPMIHALGPEVAGSLALANTKAKKEGFIVVMRSGEVSKEGDVIDLSDEPPCLGVVRK